MIRLTEAQYRNLAASQYRKEMSKFRLPPSEPMSRGKIMKPRVKSRLKEVDVTKQCVQLMEAHGWKAIRLQRGLMRRRDGSVAMTIGEKGMCDWLFLKSSSVSKYPGGQALVFMCEFKAPGRKPSRGQMHFMMESRAVGLVAEWFDRYEKFAEFVRLTFGVK